MILIAVGLPAFLRAYHSYQLSNAATQVKDMMLLTRYEAIRLNKPINCIIQPSASNPGMTSLWADSIVNNQLDPTEKTILLGNSGNLVDSGTVPGISTLFTALGSLVPLAPSPSGSTVQFDARGAVIPPTNVTVFYLASSVAPEAGYRAVLLLPAGSVQMWTSDASGNWQQQQ
jgi:Tfp pilus assembly protein FimT